MSSEGRTTPKVQDRLSMVTPVAEDLASGLPTDHAGRLVAIRSIGVGGMGEVIEVDDMALRRRTAKKMLHPELQSSVRSQRMFLREARITGQLEHPNIVPVHDLGLDTSGRLYFTMKRVDGQTLRDHVKGLPPGPFDKRTLFNLVDIVIRVCDALSYAHSRGVMHCDLKASNVMVGDFGQVYLVDWGVARVDAKHAQASQAVDDGLPPAPDEQPAISGTPTSMAAEQARGEFDQIGPRTDVFAVGALLYEVIAGEPPYQAPNMMAALYKAAMGDCQPIALTERGRALSPELVRIIDRAMKTHLTERYPDVSALREDLVHFVRGEGEFPKSHFPAGSVILREGEPGDAAYRIVSGTCAVTITRDGVTTRVRSMHAGDLFGEMAILSPGPRTATVVAETDVVAEVISADVFKWELDGLRPWFAAVVETLANRFRERGL